MRELKFRAWHPEQGMTITPVLKRNDYTGSIYCEGFDKNLNLFKLDLMQYTGLKDKNGVEIYEGDIVKWGHVEGYEERIPREAVVEFSPDISFKTFNLENNHRFRFGSFAYKDTERALEVIGNIHQNPELLK